MAIPERLQRNRTSKPLHVRADMAGNTDEMLGDRYDPAPNDAYEGGRGLPKDSGEHYPSGHVPTRSWNTHRPMRKVRTDVHRSRDMRMAMD